MSLETSIPTAPCLQAYSYPLSRAEANAGMEYQDVQSLRQQLREHQEVIRQLESRIASTDAHTGERSILDFGDDYGPFLAQSQELLNAFDQMDGEYIWKAFATSSNTSTGFWKLGNIVYVVLQVLSFACLIAFAYGILLYVPLRFAYIDLAHGKDAETWTFLSQLSHASFESVADWLTSLWILLPVWLAFPGSGLVSMRVLRINMRLAMFAPVYLFVNLGLGHLIPGRHGPGTYPWVVQSFWGGIPKNIVFFVVTLGNCVRAHMYARDSGVSIGPLIFWTQIPPMVGLALTMMFVIHSYLDLVRSPSKSWLAFGIFPLASMTFSIANAMGRNALLKVRKGHPGQVSALNTFASSAEYFVKRVCISAMPNVGSLILACVVSSATDTLGQLTIDIKDVMQLRMAKRSNPEAAVFNDRRRRRMRADALVYHVMCDFTSILVFEVFLLEFRLLYSDCKVLQSFTTFATSVVCQVLVKLLGTTSKLALETRFGDRLNAWCLVSYSGWSPIACLEVWQLHHRRIAGVIFAYLLFFLAFGTSYLVPFYVSYFNNLANMSAADVCVIHL